MGRTLTDARDAGKVRGPKKSPPTDYAFMAGSGKGYPAPEALFSYRRSAVLVPAACPQHDPHDREHDRHFDEDTDDRGERGSRLEAEERDCRCDRELEEVGGADQCRRAGHPVRHAE